MPQPRKVRVTIQHQDPAYIVDELGEIEVTIHKDATAYELEALAAALQEVVHKTIASWTVMVTHAHRPTSERLPIELTGEARRQIFAALRGSLAEPVEDATEDGDTDEKGDPGDREESAAAEVEGELGR